MYGTGNTYIICMSGICNLHSILLYSEWDKIKNPFFGSCAVCELDEKQNYVFLNKFSNSAVQKQTPVSWGECQNVEFSH